MAVALLVPVSLAARSAVDWSGVWQVASSPGRLDIGAPDQTEPYPSSIGHPLVRLAAAGDVGTGGVAEKATARVIDGLETDGEFDALLLLGDNVYPSGNPDQVDAKILRPFSGVLDGSTELVAALGNHDVAAGHGEPLMRALGLPGRWYERTYGPVHLVVVDSNRAADPAQLRWLEGVLSAPGASTWTVVIQHHPPFSAGFHGSNAASRKWLVPLYEAAGVDLVLAGHDHDYQRITPQNGVTYVVSGGAAKLRRTGRAGFTAVAASTYHFLELAVFADRIEVRAVDQDRRVIDSFEVPA